jgi:perosamine synthetase
MTEDTDNYLDIVNKIRKIHTNDPNVFIPLHAPIFCGNEKKYLNECIDSTFVSSVGPFVDRIEKEMAEFTGSKYAIACVNGTAALHIALLLAGVQENELVITQSLSFVATANAIKYCNANPVFLDVDLTTMSLSPTCLENFLTNETTQIDGKCIHKSSNKRIGAVVPMHTFGICANLSALSMICKNHNIPLVEDAAESLGSFYGDKHSGTIGLLGTLSFNGNKTITSGGGGFILTQDAELAKRAKYLTTQAKEPHAWKFYHTEIGYNYRMPNINAALLTAQLEQLPKFLKSKRAIANEYKNLFDAHSDITFVSEPENQTSNYWLCSILMNSQENRDAFLEISNKHNTMCRPAWELLHGLPPFSNDILGSTLENSYYIQSRLVNLPSSPNPRYW